MSSLKRMDITVPTFLPLSDPNDPTVHPGCWRDQVVDILRDEKYHRFPARDGLEYARIRDAFHKTDFDGSGYMDMAEMSALLRELDAHPRQLLELKAYAISQGHGGGLGWRRSSHMLNSVATVPSPTSAESPWRPGAKQPAPKKKAEGADSWDNTLSTMKANAVEAKAEAEGEDEDEDEDEAEDEDEDEAEWDRQVKIVWNTMMAEDDDGRISFDEFRAWWPRDDTTVFSVITVHAQQLMHKLHEKGIGTMSCKNTFLTISDIGVSNPLPPDPLIDQYNQSIEEHRTQGCCAQLMHGRILGHGLSHWIMGAGGHSRGTVEEIYKQVASGAERTFNFTMNLIMASVIAGVGIATNSPVSTVASMLISPLMGPILAVAFGTSIANWCSRTKPGEVDYGKKLLRLGMINTAHAIATTWVCGFLQGFLYALYARQFNWPTPEMTGRGEPTNLLGGLVVATASGFVVGVAITGGGINALVGVAISASLLPPIVNCGMCCAFAMIGPSLYDCLGADGFWSNLGLARWRRTRFLPEVVNGTVFMTEQVVPEACSVDECEPWSLQALRTCDPVSSELGSCACRYGTAGLDPMSPWIMTNQGGAPVTFGPRDYVFNGFISLGLFFLNFFIVFVFASIVFHVKRVKANPAEAKFLAADHFIFSGKAQDEFHDKTRTVHDKAHKSA